MKLNPSLYIGMGKIDTIKALREAIPFLGLATAKDIVDGWERRGEWRGPDAKRCPTCDGKGWVK